MWYLLWSGARKQWWRSGGMGYTPDMNEAGWFTETAAKRHEESSRPRGDERTIAVPMEDMAMTFLQKAGASL